jgi:hypothetical protein
MTGGSAAADFTGPGSPRLMPVSSLFNTHSIKQHNHA